MYVATGGLQIFPISRKFASNLWKKEIKDTNFFVNFGVKCIYYTFKNVQFQKNLYYKIVTLKKCFVTKKEVCDLKRNWPKKGNVTKKKGFVEIFDLEVSKN